MVAKLDDTYPATILLVKSLVAATEPTVETITYKRKKTVGACEAKLERRSKPSNIG